MKKEIKLEDYQEYIYVVCDDIGDITDISIFEKEEWDYFLDISKVFDEAVRNLNGSSDNFYEETPDNIKKATYYLYYCDFCKYSTFINLEYQIGSKNDIYIEIFNLVKKGDNKVSIDKFREWILENYYEIHRNYKILTEKI